MPSLRGSGLQVFNASSVAVSWPSGTVAGDLAIVWMASGFTPILPSGWNQADLQPGSFWQGGTFWKVLTSSDITAGSVTLSYSGAFNGVAAIAVVVGSVYPLKYVSASRNNPGSASISLAGSGLGVVSADLVLHFGSNRAGSTDTVGSGSLLQQGSDGSAASGCLYLETGSSGVLTQTFSYSTAGSGNYQASVAVGTIVLAGPLIACPVAPGAGAFHQRIQSPASSQQLSSYYNPVPAGSELKGGTAGTPYSETVTAQGGSSPYTFAVTSGALPTGLSLSSSGIVSGTPSGSGSSTFTVRVTDSNGYTGSQSFSIAIAVVSSVVGNYGVVS